MKVGDEVEKVGGDYSFSGWIVSKFTKRTGATRFVVEDSRGLLFIFNETNLQLINKVIEKPVKRDCNRHTDCDAAQAAAKARGGQTDCCHDDCCEDCFGN